ncbi:MULTISPECIES: DUF4286 family protein [unclassified Sphingobium]|uniref:DUF4286 family protein n=1 Tax=unclassified Sphingobium TaxID=2611147 RepID=UPI000D16A4C5|nr:MULTISPECIES: DUF4286 family protein [unclassified Sphingobium]MBG6120026.1 hypothetical protein [Sphingobium sp. JAI105]PSO12917.1 hypothetical protein C7E20_03980 [Sphingobium sp. AEW4]TWD05773.1 hypothetical protein FB595_109133 [Sphingobium sp. AEW010]TWD23326.1 hypothetical protein FB596_109133 [Sphingobium sp. AEW013]TWD25186.1 hypothetical protein FB594_109133 [Sphingobium sp. AEW001]
MLYHLHVFSSAKDGQDEAYNQWYDSTHLPDVTGLDWVNSGKRYRLGAGDAARYLAIYEVEADAPGDVVPKLRGAASSMRMSDTLDPSTVSFRVYEAHMPVA